MTDITWSSLNWFDILILSILAVSVLVSLFRGFLREAISLLTWIVAAVVALKFALPLSDIAKPIIDSETARYILAFLAIFLAVLIAGIIVNAIIRRLLSKSKANVLDRLIGFFFGLGRGILLVSLVLLLMRVSDLQESPAVNKSELAPNFNGTVSWLGDFLPEQIQKVAKWTQVVKKDPQGLQQGLQQGTQTE